MKLFKKSVKINAGQGNNVFNNIYEKITFCEVLEDVESIDFSNGKFKNCNFENFNFDGQTFHRTTFEKCSFENCNFINCKIQLRGSVKFYFCDFYKVNIMDCNLKGLHIKETNLMQVTFKNTFMSGCNLIGNSYESVTFEENCNLMDATIDDNYKKFDVSFINEKSYTRLSYGTYIGRFNYKRFIELEENLEDERMINLSISNTYMDIGSQFLKNNVSGKYGVCFYEGKRAFHRTLSGKRRTLSRIYDIVCGYGEKPSRTFIISLILIMIFGVLYMFTGLKTFSNEVISMKVIRTSLGNRGFIKLLIYSVYFSTVTFATVGYGDIMVVNAAGMVISIFEIIIGVFMVGVWTSTLVRKMTR